MDKLFLLTPQAEEDLIEIWNFIAKDSEDQADIVIDKIFLSFKKLCNNPDIGHKREDITSRRVKFWRIYSYLIVYRYDKKPIEIITILHGARELKILLKDL